MTDELFSALRWIIGIARIRRWLFAIVILISLIILYCVRFVQHNEFDSLLLVSRSEIRKNKPIKLPWSVKYPIDIYPPPMSDTSLPSEQMTKEYVAICMAVKNQAYDLPEFVVHHYYHLGIKRFYIMDDGSTPPLSKSLAHTNFDDEVRSALTFLYWTEEVKKNKSSMQSYLYDECVRRFGDRHTWMAFIDADEYLEMTGQPRTTLNDFLHTFEDGKEKMLPRDSTLRGKIGAVGVNWRTHNSNGVEKRPPQGECRKTFTSCLRDFPSVQNQLVKSIVKTKWYDHTHSVHMFQLKHNRKTVGELGDLLHTKKRLPITRTHITLHHYTVKSKEEFKEKMKRPSNRRQRDWSFWERIRKTPNITCNDLASYTT